MKHRKRWLIPIIVVGLAAAVVGWIGVQRRQERQVLETHRTFLRALEQGAYSQAYRLMSSQYRKSHTLVEFRGDVGGFEASPGSAWICSFVIMGHCTIYQENAAGWTVGLVYEYMSEDDEWRFTGKGEYYVD